MILEQKILDVSNRSSGKTIDWQFEAEKNRQAKPQIKVIDSKPKIVKQNNKKKDWEVESKAKKPLESDLTDKVIDKADLGEQYGLFENQDLPSVDYGSLFSYLGHQKNAEENYQFLDQKEDKSVLFESEEEIEETVLKINVAYALGDKNSISYREKEKLRNLADFNYTLVELHQSLSPIKSRDVDYSRLN